jgi:hypothetical protein
MVRVRKIQSAINEESTPVGAACRTMLIGSSIPA